MKIIILSSIVSIAASTTILANDIYSLSDRLMMLEDRTSANEKKIKQLSTTQTKNNTETKKQIDDLRHNQVRLELEQIRSNQPKVHVPQQPTFHKNTSPNTYRPPQTRNQETQRHNEFPMAQFSNHPEFVISPYNGRLVSIRGIPPRQLVMDPFCGQLFLIP